jgi:serine/threonine-protein kinase
VQDLSSTKASDLKPDNVMIVRDSEALGGERAKILDFGIAKGNESTVAGESSFVKTQTGALMGTPRYMSPEQCRGMGEISGKSDVYSLGVMLYEMVSGRPPMVAEASGELIAMHLSMSSIRLCRPTSRSSLSPCWPKIPTDDR